MLSRLTTNKSSQLAQELQINDFTVLGEMPISADDIADETRKDSVAGDLLLMITSCLYACVVGSASVCLSVRCK